MQVYVVEEVPAEPEPADAFRTNGLVELLAIDNNGSFLALGPRLPDGRQTLIVVSDNNFSDSQATQFIALALELKTTPAALPVVETPTAIDEEDADSPLKGYSDDPAIRAHPKKPGKSMVIASQKEGGLVVFDMKGRVLRTIPWEKKETTRSCLRNFVITIEHPITSKGVENINESFFQIWCQTDCMNFACHTAWCRRCAPIIATKDLGRLAVSCKRLAF